MSRTVLVVDDDPLVLDVLAAMLDDMGCDVLTAQEGMEALDRLRRDQRIEVLITDINMPLMDGRELARRAVGLRPGLHVVLLSGRDGRRDSFPIIRKPFTEQDLAETMRNTTGGAC